MKLLQKYNNFRTKENIYRILRPDPRNQAVRPDFIRLHQKS